MYNQIQADDLFNMGSLWRIVHRRRWTILIIFLFTFSTTLIWTMLQKPVYRTGALLEIEGETPKIPTETGGLQPAVSDAYLQTQQEIMSSRSLIAAVIEELNIRRLPGRLSVTPLKGSRLLRVNFESTEPQMAARVVNTLITKYTEQDIQRRSEKQQQASEWLSQRLTTAKERLEASERELDKYIRETGLQFLNVEDSSENIISPRLRQLQAELTHVEAARQQKESFYRLVQSGDYQSLPRLYQSPLIEDLLAVQLWQLKHEEAELAATASPDDPQIPRIQNQIQNLETVLAREREHIAERVTSDYLAAMKREELARDTFEAELHKARQISHKLIQYNILKREVETNHALYAGLLENLKQTSVSAEWKGSTIRVVDRAGIPKSPVRPVWLLNLSLGGILGFGVGVGFAFLQDTWKLS